MPMVYIEDKELNPFHMIYYRQYHGVNKSYEIPAELIMDYELAQKKFMEIREKLIKAIDDSC